MGTARETDIRLRSFLNTDQSGRERMCLAILALDRNYTNVRPRRPEGGPDGGRDIECERNGEQCFGAVGFVNSATDSTAERRQVRNKFESDLGSAIEAAPLLKAFTFFTNVDLTPAEIADLTEIASNRGITAVDIYYRERIRMALDGVEGLGIRFQYLSVPMSEAEQAAFFSRFGRDLEDLVRGRFDRIESKLDELEFCRWRSGAIRRIDLELEFTGFVDSRHLRPEHFRAALEMQGVWSEHRSVILGVRDSFWPCDRGGWYFGTDTFFFREQFGSISDSWIPHGGRVGGGLVSGIHAGVRWRPVSDILATSLDGLSFHLHLTENLIGRIGRARLLIDDYVFLNCDIQNIKFEPARPSLGWPSELTPDESKVGWVYHRVGGIDLHRMPSEIVPRPFL